MALNIKNVEVERLATEVAALARETKTEAIKNSLKERLARLSARSSVASRRKKAHEFMERVIWPEIPPEVLGKPLSKKEREAVLGIGPEGF